MEFAFRINLLSLVLATFALNIALVLASSASAVALEQPRLSDAGDAAEEEISYYRQQPLALTQERFARAGASGGKVPFYPNYRFGSVRLITPYALQHLLASRFQNADYPGCPWCVSGAQVGSSSAKRAVRFAVPRIGKSDPHAAGQLLPVSSLNGEVNKAMEPAGVAVEDMEKVKKFHSSQLYGIKGLPYGNFMYYTKGNEFLGGPGKR